ncbi:MAG: hypothetical protein ACXABY_30830 [Candidatus Thorarchaeota archaeon]|jgi:hypothetical protein
MFTIKVIRANGCTVYGAEMYHYEWDKNKVTITITPRASKQAESYPVTVGSALGFKTVIYFENSAGKTIDTIRFAEAKE